MTHSIRKTLLVIAREIITLLPVLAYTGFYYYDRHFEVSFKWFVIFNSTVLCVYTLLILLSSKIKKTITLTEEERNLSPDMYPDYSSSFDWLSVIIWTVSCFLSGIILFSHRGLIVAIVMASLPHHPYPNALSKTFLAHYTIHALLINNSCNTTHCKAHNSQ